MSIGLPHSLSYKAKHFVASWPCPLPPEYQHPVGSITKTELCEIELYDMGHKRKLGLEDNKNTGPEEKAAKCDFRSSEVKTKEYGEDEDGASWRSGPA